jgi:hypothetical protein
MRLVDGTSFALCAGVLADTLPNGKAIAYCLDRVGS